MPGRVMYLLNVDALSCHGRVSFGGGCGKAALTIYETSLDGAVGGLESSAYVSRRLPDWSRFDAPPASAANARRIVVIE